MFYIDSKVLSAPVILGFVLLSACGGGGGTGTRKFRQAGCGPTGAVG